MKSFGWWVGGIVGAATAAAIEIQPMERHLIDASHAQATMLAEEGLMEEVLATKLHEALEKAGAEMLAGERSLDPSYLKLERRLVELAGAQASDIHLGRSRNDLGATINRMAMRERILALIERIGRVRGRLHALSAKHVATVMPGFTQGVQAQPTTVAHFLLAFDASLGRDVERLRELYRRVNRSPLGSAAFTTSGFPLDRERLAELLAFDGLVENSYDAIMISTAETKAELSSAMGLAALNVGRFAQYLLFQYADSDPGFMLGEGLTTRSSIMPQKRNPSAVERLRLVASEVAGNAQTSWLMIHNTPLYEVKDVREDHFVRLMGHADVALDMFARLDEVLASLVVRKESLRRKVDADFSTMTELADALHRKAGVPFRIGHEVASELSTYGRSRSKPPVELTWAEVDAVYRKVTKEKLPLDEAELKRVFDAGAFVSGRQGTGGPQADSVKKMLGDQKAHVREDMAWVKAEGERLAAALGRVRE